MLLPAPEKTTVSLTQLFSTLCIFERRVCKTVTKCLAWCSLKQLNILLSTKTIRRDVPVRVPLDLYTPTGMSCIGTYGDNCKSDNVSKYRPILVTFQLL